MSLRLLCIDESAPAPRPTALELTCDGDHGLFPPAPVRFTGEGYIAQHQAAMQAGWLDRGDMILGPCCSGKTAVTRPGRHDE